MRVFRSYSSYTATVIALLLVTARGTRLNSINSTP
jgi:hypothetical protein